MGAADDGFGFGALLEGRLPGAVVDVEAGFPEDPAARGCALPADWAAGFALVVFEPLESAPPMGADLGLAADASAGAEAVPELVSAAVEASAEGVAALPGVNRSG